MRQCTRIVSVCQWLQISPPDCGRNCCRSRVPTPTYTKSMLDRDYEQHKSRLPLSYDALRKHERVFQSLLHPSPLLPNRYLIWLMRIHHSHKFVRIHRSTLDTRIHTHIVTDRPPDLIAFGITILMTCVLALGASKSVMFNNALNVINFATWVFIMTAGWFYVDTDMWHEHEGFLPFGWSGVSRYLSYNITSEWLTQRQRSALDLWIKN